MRNRTVLFTHSTGTIEDEIDRLFDQLLAEGVGRMTHQARTWSPPADVFETDEYFLVRLEVAGMDEEDFHIVFQENLLFIKGERTEPDGPRRLYHQMQIRYGSFLTVVRFEGAIHVDDVEAEYRAGFLTVRLPKKDSGGIRNEVEER